MKQGSRVGHLRVCSIQKRHTRSGQPMVVKYDPPAAAPVGLAGAQAVRLRHPAANPPGTRTNCRLGCCWHCVHRAATSRGEPVRAAALPAVCVIINKAQQHHKDTFLHHKDTLQPGAARAVQLPVAAAPACPSPPLAARWQHRAVRKSAPAVPPAPHLPPSSAVIMQGCRLGRQLVC